MLHLRVHTLIMNVETHNKMNGELVSVFKPMMKKHLFLSLIVTTNERGASLLRHANECQVLIL